MVLIGAFDRTPLAGTADNLKYFWDCCVAKKARKDRFEELNIEHCNFWFIDDEMSNKYDELKRYKCGILSAKLRYGKYIYCRFEHDFGSCEHESWCRYYKYATKLRDGIEKLGKTLHAICHPPLDLIQYRTVGLHLYKEDNIIDLDSIKESIVTSCDDQKLTTDQFLDEDAQTKYCRFILRREQFIRHYFEITTLRDIISEEIKFNEDKKSTINGWMWFVGGLLIAVISIGFSTIWKSASETATYPIMNQILPVSVSILSIALLLVFIWHIWVSIKLNEAKDVMYICLGVDIDNPQSTDVSE